MNRNLVKLYIMLFLVFGCNQKQNLHKNKINKLLIIPNNTVDKKKLLYNNKKSIWTLKEKLYSGFVVTYYPDKKTLKEKFSLFNGKKENKEFHWYPDGHYKRISAYKNGKLNGSKKSWSNDSLHVLVSHYQFIKGKPHGIQKKWYTTGGLFKKMNLNMGKEEGIQQAFRKNGDLYTNYEAKNGRIFGLKKAELCYSLEDEKVKYKK